MDRKLCSLLAFVTFAGCHAGAKAPVHDTFTKVGSGADSTASIPTVTYGGSSGPTKVREFGYGWLQFNGHVGDNVDLWVRSSDGDAVAFLLDAHDDVIASNDDAEPGSSDAHLTAPLAADGVYYIAYREYSYARARFTVALSGAGIFSCGSDADCIAVQKAGCCPNGSKEAINASEKEAYDVSFGCPDTSGSTICPKYVVLDNRVAACNATSKQCELVAP